MRKILILLIAFLPLFVSAQAYRPAKTITLTAGGGTYNVSSSIESFDTRMNRRYVRMTGGRSSRASLNAQYLPRTPHSAFSTFPDSLMGPLASLPRTPSRNVGNPHESPGLDAMIYIPSNPQTEEEPMEPMELSPFTRYTVSQDPMSPYATPQQRKTMTRISRSVDL